MDSENKLRFSFCTKNIDKEKMKRVEDILGTYSLVTMMEHTFYCVGFYGAMKIKNKIKQPHKISEMYQKIMMLSRNVEKDWRKTILIPNPIAIGLISVLIEKNFILINNEGMIDFVFNIFCEIENLNKV